MATRAELIVKYNAMRDEYLEIGDKIDEAMRLLSEVREIIKEKGEWGYKHDR